MDFRKRLETLYQNAIAEFTGCAEFTALERGTARKSDYDRFIVNVARTHLRSPQLLAFVFAVAPPEAQTSLMHNLLEELGVDDGSGVPHPTLVRKLLSESGLEPLLLDLEERAAEDIRQVVVDPLLYPSLREVGLSALVEIEAFEYMLSRVASRIARALVTFRKLSPATVEWFTHHSEVDIKHAEQGLGNLETYLEYYDFSPEEAATIAEMALRENVFIKRYFGEQALGNLAARIEQ